MAFTSHPAPASFGATLYPALTALGRALAAPFLALVRLTDASATVHARLAEAERLQAKSDDELAALGLKRDEISHVVFRDLFWQ